ncbi:hypothetical protein EDB19DRAFT_2011364 [Suillus lakei]|nr:hypothetical protein EDB19DRAFT_2011364 [Suillus lakei]
MSYQQENEDACIKLFSDSAKDAKEQGQKKKQSGTSRDIFYSQVAQAVFSNDKDLEVQRLFKEDPKAFIKPVSTHFGTQRKYNEFNKELKQSGAGKTYAELQEDPKMKSLIDAGQDFVSAALEHFNVSKQSQPPATCDDDTHMDDDPEDIVELVDGAMDGAGIVDGADDMMVDRSPHMESFGSQSSAPSPLLCLDHSPSNTPNLFSLVPLPQWCRQPQLPPITTSESDTCGVILLNSPEHSPAPKKNDTDNSLSFFSDLMESSPSHQSTPIGLEDSDTGGASRALQSLRVSSLNGSHKSSPSLPTKQSRAPTQSASPYSSRAPSSSHKCPGSSALEQTSAAAEMMSQTTESLILHLDNKCEGRIEQEHYKCMKLESDIWAHDLKVCSACDEWEHTMRLAAQDHIHQQERMTQQIEFARMEIELSHACCEEEEARIHRIAMEHGFNQA